MRVTCNWLRHPSSTLLVLGLLLLVLPLLSRYTLGWSHAYGYLSDLAIGSLLVVLLHQRSWLLSIALLLVWCIFTLSTAELVNAVGRMPEPSDLQYLGDAQFVSHSTQEGGLSQPWLVVAVAAVLALYLTARAVQRGVAMRPLSWAWLLAPGALLGVHALYQYQSPSAAEQWQQFNLPHKLLAEGLSGGQMHLRDWLLSKSPNQAPDVSAFTTLDLNGASLLADTGLVVAGAGAVDLWARIDTQRIMDVRSRATLAPLALGARQPWHREGEDERLTSPPVAFERADLLARWQVDANGWQLHAPELHFHETGRTEPHSFDGLWLAGGERFALQAPRMDLAPARALATLSRAVPAGLRQWLHEASPDGVLHAVRVHGSEGDWSGSARIDGVGWDPYGDRPGVQGLGGSVAYDQDGGVLRLSEGPARFDWPRFRQPIDFRLGGTLGWWRQGGEWTAGASDLRIRGADFGARLRAELHFPGESRRPRVDLAAVVDPSPMKAASQFWVQGKMPPATIDWLDRALLDGSIEQGRAVLSGDLGDWPFLRGEGRFDGRVRVSQARIAFNPEWPDAEAMDLDVAFDGPGMTLEGEGAILGNRVRRVAGGIADFRDPRLVLDIEAPASGESLQALMLASPLRQRFDEHLRNASIRGPAEVTLALDLPLAARLGGRRIEGTIDLAGARLADPRWDIDLREVNGRTRFSDRGFAAESLSVLFDGEPARFSLLVGEDYVGDARLAARATLVGAFPAQTLLARHPPLAWLDPHVDGRGFWDIRVDVPVTPDGQPAPPSRLRVESDLAGVRLDLPAPLAKAADLGLPMRLDVPLPVSKGEVQLRLGSLARLRGRIDEQGRLTGALRLGEDGPLDLPDSGLVVLGHSATLDAAGWIGFAGSGRDADAGPGEGGGQGQFEWLHVNLRWWVCARHTFGPAIAIVNNMMCRYAKH